jgi:hypothetical protein
MQNPPALRVARKRLSFSDAPERLCGQECERSGAPPPSGHDRLHLLGEFTRPPGCAADFGAKRAGNAIPISYIESELAADRLSVGELRLLRLVGRVYDRAGNGVRCGMPNVTSLPPLPNDASVPRQFREARPQSLDEVASVDCAALRDQLGRGVRCSELSERQPGGTAQADSEQPIRARGIVVAHLAA